MMEQPGKRAKAVAPDWSNQGGAAHNQGQEHPERDQETGRRPPGLEHPGAAEPRTGKCPNWFIRGGTRRHAGGPP